MDRVETTLAAEPVVRREKYARVNGAWPEGTNSGRNVIPTSQEAISGAKRLFRAAMGRAWKGKWAITSGRRYTYPRRGVFYVNPNSTWDAGWHGIVHGISHYASAKLYNENHGMRHAYIERTLIEYAVTHGFLTGKLKREPKVKAKADPVAKVEAAIKRWEAKRKRADTALKKLHRKHRHYARQSA